MKRDGGRLFLHGGQAAFYSLTLQGRSSGTVEDPALRCQRFLFLKSFIFEVFDCKINLFDLEINLSDFQVWATHPAGAKPAPTQQMGERLAGAGFSHVQPGR